MFTADESCSGLPHFFWRARAQAAMFFDCSQEQEDLPRAGRILGRRMFLCVGSSSKVRQILSSQQLEVAVKISNNDITTSRGLQVFTSLRIRGRAWWAPPGSPTKSAFNGADPKSNEAVPESNEAVPK